MTLSTALSRPAWQAVALLASVMLLGACASGGGARTAPPDSDEIPPLPRLEDPQLERMLQTVNVEYRRWLSNPDGYMTLPAQPGPWPCDVPQAERQRLAGIADPNDPKTLAVYAKSGRQSGMKAGLVKPPGVENVRVYLLKGECARGKLQGPLELMAEYVSVSSVLDNVTRTPQRIFTRETVKDGKPVGTTLRVQLQGEQQESKPSAIKIKVLAGTFSLHENTKPPRGVTLSYMRTEAPKPLMGSYVSVTQSVSASVPLRGDRWKLVMYNGPVKTTELNFKGEAQHGKAISHAYSFKSPYSPDPVRIPASEACYDEGELIKSAACDVD